METLDDLFYGTAALREDLTAVVYDDGNSEVSSLTYGQLQRKAHLVRHGLRCRGLVEEVVGVLVSTSPELPALLIGIMSAPAAFMPLENIALRGTLERTLAQLNIQAIIVSESRLEALQQNFPTMCLRTEPLDSGLVLVWVGDRTTKTRWKQPLAYIITTSGSTGEPKIIKVPHTCVLPNVTHISLLYGIGDRDVSVLMSPLTFDPCIVEMFVALSVGAQILILPELIKMLPQQLLPILLKHQVSVMQTTPTLFSNLVKHRALMRRFLGANTSLRVVALGGEPCPPTNTISTWRGEGNTTMFINLYGVTEVSSWATYHIVHQQTCSDGDVEVPLGLPLNETVIEIRDEMGRPLLEGEGQLYVGGVKRVCVVGEESDAPSDGLRATGDQVLITPDRGLYYRGRLDRQIKRHGKRLNLDSLELVVSRQSDVVNSATVVSNDGRLYLFVQVKPSEMQEKNVIKQSENPITDEENDTKVSGNPIMIGSENLICKLRRYIGDNLPAQYMPDSVNVVEKIPYTRHGKVDRKHLLSTTTQQEQKRQENFKSDLEEVLRSAWKECLPDGDNTDINESSRWLRSGGDSFTAVHLLSQLTHTLSVNPTTLLDTILTGSYSEILHLLRESLEKYKVPDPQQKSETKRGHELQELGKETEREYRLQEPENEFEGEHRLQGEGNNSEEEHILQQLGSPTKAPRDIGLDFQSQRFSSKTFPLPSAVRDQTQRVKLAQNDTQSMKRVHGEDPSEQGSDVKRTCSGDEREVEGRTLDPKRSYIEDQQGDSLSIEQTNPLSSKQDTCTCRNPFMTLNRCNRVMSCCEQYRSHHGLVPERLRPTTGQGGCDGASPQHKLELVPCWSVDTGKCIDASPLILVSRCESLVFVGSHSHRFIAVSVKNGDIVWEQVLTDRIESSACVTPCGQFVVVGCYGGSVYYLSVTSGEVFWMFETLGQVKSSPSADPVTGYVYVGSHDQTLYALDIKIRASVWRVGLGAGSIYSSPVVDLHHQAVYIGTLGGVLASVDTTKGTLLWQQSLSKPIFSSPCLLPAGIAVGCVDGNMYAFSHSGEPIWTFEASDPIFSSPSCSFQSLKNYTKKHIIFGCHGNALFCIDTSGQLLWKYQTSSPVFSSPFVTKTIKKMKENLTTIRSDLDGKRTDVKDGEEMDIVVCCDTTGHIVIVNVLDGECLGQYQLPGEVFSSPVVYGDRLYIGCRDDYLYCLKLIFS